METKKTAVEWLAEKIKIEFGFVFSNNILEKAKDLEKEQIETAFSKGQFFASDYFDPNNREIECCENYYNKSFKNK
jgi:hypothetical protein